MRLSKLFGKSIHEAPKDETATNAKLLIRGGFIDKLMSGSYTLLPLGLRVKDKIQQIVREEMNAIHAQEVLMPLLHPKTIWNETGRWESASEIMYKLKKDDKEYALSFTHEEIVMDLLRKHISSYKDLPVALYHFSTKFRDELRARSGILRGREFLMKDLYSAHATEQGMWDYYWQVADAYMNIFKRMRLKTTITEAGGGVFTENHTHEFQVEHEVGEDTIFMADGWKYAKNQEVMTDEDKKAPGLRSVKAIEAGNIFAFGTKKYAEHMGGLFTDEKGEKKPVWFASYGIGITRLIGILVEVFHDERGIVWPKEVAPYEVHLVEIRNTKYEIRDKSEIRNSKYKTKAENLYDILIAAGIEVLYDDRDVSAGEKFADADLIGCPVRLVVSEKTGDKVEWKERGKKETELLSIHEAIKRVGSN